MDKFKILTFLGFQIRLGNDYKQSILASERSNLVESFFI